uniref:Secreted protein n=1 Tax=Rhizophora mucronata TaxID=61149 RepID=A0A2P2LUF7_RHIMU
MCTRSLKSLLGILSHSACTQTLQPSQHTQLPPCGWRQIFLHMPQYCFDFLNLEQCSHRNSVSTMEPFFFLMILHGKIRSQLSQHLMPLYHESWGRVHESPS